MRQIPENYTRHIENKELKLDIYEYEAFGNIAAVAFQGRRQKPSFRYKFDDENNRTLYINKFIQGKQEVHDEKVKYKEEQKSKKAEEFKNIKVGDIFHCGWGFEQTQCDFYELVELKGKTATFQPIQAETVPGSEGHDCDRRRAVPGSVNGKTFNKRLNGNTFKLSSFQYVTKCDVDDTFYCSWYY